VRSLLFVPGDSPAKLDKALASGADVLLVDLEDSVGGEAKAKARDTAREFLLAARAREGRPRLFVRVNGLETGLTDADLDAVMQAAPEGVLLPKSLTGADIQHVAAKLAVREAENELPDGVTRILALATESGQALFGMASYRRCSHRLAGLAWGAEDLAADLGAETNRLPDGSYADPYRLARTLTLAAAAAAQVVAIDTVYTAFRDTEGLRREAEQARRDGFGAKLAIHPAQVPVINEVFTPTPEAVARARRIVAAFADNPGCGVISLDGTMLDLPHLKQAERLLSRADGPTEGPAG
jgi:citrate lyase subunit beta/citryl-CoA lyase